MKPKAGYGYLEAAAHFAAESSTGTNVEVSTTDDFTRGVDALVYTSTRRPRKCASPTRSTCSTATSPTAA
jgi:ribulose 1,5-bisphosphate carboxylase large subunit-like protein